MIQGMLSYFLCDFGSLCVWHRLVSAYGSVFVCEQDHSQFTLPLPAHLEVEIGSKIGDEGHVLASRHVLHANGDPGHQIRVVQGFTWETWDGVRDEGGGCWLRATRSLQQSHHTIDEAVQAGHGLLRDEKVIPAKRMNGVLSDAIRKLKRLHGQHGNYQRHSAPCTYVDAWLHCSSSFLCVTAMWYLVHAAATEWGGVYM